MNIAVLPGDGIGPEIVAEAVRVLRALRSDGLPLEFEYAPVGAAAFEVSGEPLPAATLDLAARADAVLFGAVGDPRQDALPRELRPEQAILGLRKALGLYTNLRPAKVHDALVDASPLKAERVRGVDLMIVRELNGDIYFGQPKGRGINADGADEGFDTMRYSAPEVERVARRAFTLARARRKRLCSVDKSNVLESMQLWRDVVTNVGRDYPDVDLTHMYVDNAAMQLVRAPLEFDVLLTGNMFGDILSDEASMITGSIGLLPSAALGDGQRGLYEPIHGSAPDIAGRGIANPIGTILSAALMLRYSGGFEAEAARIERAVERVLDDGLRTVDLARPGAKSVSTSEIGGAIVAAL